MSKTPVKKDKSFTGKYRQKSIVSNKFIEVFDKLKREGVFAEYGDFCVQYGYDGKIMSNIANGRSDVPLKLLWAMVVDYGIDANVFFDV